MTDKLDIKSVAINTVGATQLPGSAISFERVVSEDTATAQRASYHIGSLSPTIMRVFHLLPKKSGAVTRSTMIIDQTLSRVDALSNQIGTNVHSVGLQLTRDSGTTLAESRASFALLAGALLANDGQLFDSLFKREQ